MKLRRIVIVGGGTAGWMTATHLAAALNRGGLEVADIGVVAAAGESTPDAGEATIPDINRYLSILGIDQLAFIRRVGGTLRQGTRFVGWLDGKGEHYYHPVSTERRGSIDRSAQRWLRSNRSVSFAETVSAHPALCDMGLAPLMLTRWDFGPPLSYAFHVDESSFLDCLKELAAAAGIAYVPDPAVGVALADDGGIAAVLTEGGQRIEADLFVDCSGPSALLAGNMSIPWVDRSQYLLCDRQVRMDVPYESRYSGCVQPFTTATALSSGWVRDVPLQHKRSLGYCYSSAFQGDQDAEQELRGFEGTHAGILATETARLRTGHREQAWVGNCITIGASANVIEPLESTDLYLIDHAASMLVEHFPLGDEMEPLAFRYNRLMVNRFYELLDFVNLHYCLTRRSDTAFWQEARRPERITDRLRAKLEFWRRKRPTASDFEDQNFPGQPDAPLPSGRAPGDCRSPIDTAGLWDHENYEAVLYGMDFLASECDEWFGTQRPDPEIPQHILARIAQAPRKLPPHATWLQRMAGMPDYPTR